MRSFPCAGSAALVAAHHALEVLARLGDRRAA
jgi:hypothetical protein